MDEVEGHDRSLMEFLLLYLRLYQVFCGLYYKGLVLCYKGILGQLFGGMWRSGGGPELYPLPGPMRKRF